METVNMITSKDLEKLERLLPVPFLVINHEQVVYTNHKFEQLTGYTTKDLDQSHLHSMLSAEHLSELYQDLDEFFANMNSTCQGELLLTIKNGSQLWLHYNFSPVNYQDQTYALAIISDVTDLKNTKTHLSKLVSLREAMLSITQSVVGVVNLDSFYESVLEKAIQEIAPAEVGSIMLLNHDNLKIGAHYGFINEKISDFELPLHESFLYKATDGSLDKIVIIDDISTLDDVYFFPLADDSTKMIKSSLVGPLYIDDIFFGCISVEATETHAFTEDDRKVLQFIRDNVEIAITNFLLQQEKHYLSQFDSLTGFYNRGFFEKFFEMVIQKTKRYEESFHLVLFDLNNLKKVNDSLGHCAGDMMIKKVCSQLRNITRKSDLLVRYGGDEFIIIFFNADKKKIIKKIEDLLCFLSSHPICKDSQPYYGSFSYGLASFKEDGETLQELVRAADLRMYEYKAKYKERHR